MSPKLKALACICAALAIVSSAVFVVDTDYTDAASKDPTITDAGFVKDRDSFFYFLKFAANGFDCGSSATSITPMSKSGSIKQDSVYVRLTGLNQDKTYYLMIEELSGDTTVAKTVIELKGKINTVVWMSISDSNLYSFGNLVESTREGDFSNTVGDQQYKATLKDSSGFSTSGKISEKIVKDINVDSKIVGLAYVKNNEEGTEMLSTGVSYGYGGITAAYAGAKMEDYDIGEYVVVFFIANDTTMKIKLDFGGKTYDVPAEKVKFPKTVSYGYAVVSSDDLSSLQIDDYKDFKATLYNGEKEYDTKSSIEDSSGDDGRDMTIWYVAIGAGAAVLIAAAIVLIRRL